MRIRVVKGIITKTTGGNHNMYSNGDIVTNAGGSINEIADKGYLYGEPEDAPPLMPFDRIINVNGHFYNKDGTFKGKIDEPGFEGSIDDVYVCDGKVQTKNSFKNNKKLDITHQQFCYIAGVIKAEESSTFESAAATTQATFNAVKFEKGDKLTMEEQSKFAEKLLSTGYSTATLKESLKDTENDSLCKNARKGLIHVLQGGKDYSEGAVLWDGIDFADRGVISARPHPKTDKDGGIHITKDLWIKFVNACEYKPDSKGIQRLYRHLEGKDGKGHDKDKTKAEALATIPFEEKKNASANDSYNIFDFGQKKSSVWDILVDSKGLKNVDYYETVGTGKYNKGRTLNKATVVVGRHIFWKPYKDHSNNEGYYWKGMMNHKL